MANYAFQHTVASTYQVAERERAEGILSGPKWPTTVWHPQMLKMLTRKPVLLPRGKRTISLLHMETARLHKKLQLLACVLPANHSKQDEVRCQIFQVIWASWQPSTRQQYASYLTRWSKFCVQLQCDPLHPPVDMVVPETPPKSALFAVVFSNSISKRNLSHPPLWNLRAVCHLIPLSFFLSFSTKSWVLLCLVIFLLIVMVHVSSFFPENSQTFFLMCLAFLYGSCWTARRWW